MAELADALDLGSNGLLRGGSSPFTCTNKKVKIPYIRGFLVLYFLKNYGNFYAFYVFYGNFMVILNYKYLSAIVVTAWMVDFSTYDRRLWAFLK